MKKGLFVRSVKFCIMSVLLWSVLSCEKDSRYATGETYYKYENLENLEYISVTPFGEGAIESFLKELTYIMNNFDGTLFSQNELVSKIQEVVEHYDDGLISGSFSLMKSNNGPNGKFKVAESFTLSYSDKYDYLFNLNISKVYGSWFENSRIYYDLKGNITDEFYNSMTDDYNYGVLTLKSDVIYGGIGNSFPYQVLYVDKVYSKGNEPTVSKKSTWWFDEQGINAGAWVDGDSYYGVKGEIISLDNNTMRIKYTASDYIYVSTLKRVSEPKHNF